MGAGDSLITSFMVAYTDHLKKGITGELQSEKVWQQLLNLLPKYSGMNGAFGYGKNMNRQMSVRYFEL